MKKQKSTISFLFGENRFVFQHGPEGAFNRHDDSHLGGKGQKGNEAKSNKKELAETGLEATLLKPAEVGKDKPISYEEAAHTTIAAGIENLKKMHEASESKADEALAYTNKFLDSVGIGKDALQKLIPEAQTDLQFYNGIRNLQTAIGINPDGKIGEKTLTAIRDYHGQDLKILAAIAQFRTEARTSFKKAIAKAKKIRRTKQASEPLTPQEVEYWRQATQKAARQENVASLPTAASDSKIDDISKGFQRLSPDVQTMLKDVYSRARNNSNAEQSFQYNIDGKQVPVTIRRMPHDQYVISYGDDARGNNPAVQYPKSFLEYILKS